MQRSTGLCNLMNGLRRNLLTNGDFETDPTVEWTAYNATLSSVSGGQSGNALQAALSSVAAAGGHQTFSNVIGRALGVELYMKKGTATSVLAYAAESGFGATHFSTGAKTNVAFEKFNFSFVPTTAQSMLVLDVTGSATGQYGLFDEAIVYELFEGFAGIFEGGKIYIYGGTLPSNADSAATGTLLATVTNNKTATGLTFTAVNDRTVIKNASEIWKGLIAATGTASHFILCEQGGDPSSASTTEARILGTVGTSGSDMTVASTSLVQNLDFEIENFTYTAPLA